ncbi:uncharacterized protein LOC132639411 [Lycium barbarum]|uniref:uncharacterized protein LOC132639411 n=1 Tax=Lycium barbarum TaxID=112863 RepID=UPI00293E647E|nr:uncharacterized protein LOC132639411 [Lycium barbarum]
MTEQTPVVVGSTSSVEKQTTMTDPNHPYYLQPSDSLGMTLIISNGAADMVIAWLLNSVLKNIRDSVIYSKSAKELWINLEQRLYGFTEDFEFNNKKGDGAQAKTNAGITEEVQEDFAMQNEPATHGSCLSIHDSKTWIIDSGASEHMCFDSSSFSSLIAFPVSVKISLPNSFRINVTHTGSVPILHNLTLKNDQSLRRVRAFGEVKEGLYLLHPKVSSVKSLSNDSVVSIQKGSDSNSLSSLSLNPVCANDMSDVKLWHVRLGHLRFSEDSLRFMLKASDLTMLLS